MTRNLMRKIAIVGVILACMSGLVSAAGLFDKINQNDQHVVVTNDIQDPLRDGSHNPGQGVKGLYYNGQITSFFQAQNETIAYIQKFVNRGLALVGIIALIYLLYNGFLMVTAAGRDDQFKKGAHALRTTVIALVGMALAGILVNFILYLISKFI